MHDAPWWFCTTGRWEAFGPRRETAGYRPIRSCAARPLESNHDHEHVATEAPTDYSHDRSSRTKLGRLGIPTPSSWNARRSLRRLPCTRGTTPRRREESRLHARPYLVDEDWQARPSDDDESELLLGRFLPYHDFSRHQFSPTVGHELSSSLDVIILPPRPPQDGCLNSGGWEP